MAQHTAFMEWLMQTRRINKSVDQICNDTIDGINKVLRFVDRKTIYRNKNFFDPFCIYYHKPNPISLTRRIRKKDIHKYHKCKQLSEFIQGSINRCWAGINMIQIQWFEIIDFMYERPELVNPNVVQDEYIIERINEACKNNKKLNPFKNGTAKRFGKNWRDKNGIWQSEKRRRF